MQVAGLGGAVHIVRDEYGVAHITAGNVHDAYFAQGYVMAHDRLPQMDILRRFKHGHRGDWARRRCTRIGSGDARAPHEANGGSGARGAAGVVGSVDRDLVVAVDAFAAGVNAYVTHVKGGTWRIDAILAVFDRRRFAPWEPADSLVLGRFQAFALSWTTPLELDITDIIESAAVFDAPGATPKLAARKGAGADLVRIKPIDRVATIDGFQMWARIRARDRTI